MGGFLGLLGSFIGGFFGRFSGSFLSTSAKRISNKLMVFHSADEPRDL